MNEYTAITKNALVEHTKLGFDLFLRNEVNGYCKYILYSCADDQFSPEKKEELFNNRNITRLYISTKDTYKYLQYQERNLKHIVDDKNRSSLEKSGILYQVATYLAEELLDNPNYGKHIERANVWVNNTINYILNNENTFSSFFKVTSHDYRTYTHSINMSVTGLLFGKYLSLTPYELNCLGMGMLLHDIGKIAIPQEIINKSGNLTKKEFNEIKKHTRTGLELLEHRSNLESLSLKIVIQHHENRDGTGYPYGIGGNDIHLFGSISRIIDVYDAITSNRPYAEAKKPFAALAEMKVKMPNCFHEELFREFIYFLGPEDLRRKQRTSDTLLHFSL